jgi:hypothetical protein
MTTDHGTAADPGRLVARVGELTEPTKAERERYADWLARHSVRLEHARVIAERLQVAYDHAATVTSADGNPEVPAVIQWEIDDLLQEWEVVRWAGQRPFSG